MPLPITLYVLFRLYRTPLAPPLCIFTPGLFTICFLVDVSLSPLLNANSWTRCLSDRRLVGIAPVQSL